MGVGSGVGAAVVGVAATDAFGTSTTGDRSHVVASNTATTTAAAATAATWVRRQPARAPDGAGTGSAMLTKKYQKKSGGFDGYSGFWSKVSNLDLASVKGDTKKQTVAYTYSYDYEGERRTEDVVLKLKKQGDTFLIDGAA